MTTTHSHVCAKGSIEVVTGGMFSGKTEELIRRLRRVQLAHLNVKVFKPTIDNRYAEDCVVSHSAQQIACQQITSATEILDQTEDAHVVGIDEAQFLGPEIVDVCLALASKGIRVIIAGLDMDYLGKPFGPMPHLMAVADDVTKVHAVCVCCGEPALFSHRTSEDENLVLIGERNRYEPLCRKCYRKTN